MFDAVARLPFTKIMQKTCRSVVIEENVGPNSLLYPILHSFDETSIGRMTNEAVTAFGPDITVGEIAAMGAEVLRNHMDLGPRRRAWLEAYLHLFGVKLSGSDTIFAMDRETLIAIDIARQITRNARIANSDSEVVLKTVRDLPLSVLDLSNRAKNSLKKAGITTVGYLTAETEAELMRIPNFSTSSLQSVRSALSPLGLTLGMETSR